VSLWRSRKDGTEIIAEACISMLRNERGDIIGAVCIKRNVTERKQIERQLRYQAQLLQNVSDAVMAVDNEYIALPAGTVPLKNSTDGLPPKCLEKNLSHSTTPIPERCK
jgi:PAS domain-containing protein